MIKKVSALALSLAALCVCTACTSSSSAPASSQASIPLPSASASVSASALNPGPASLSGPTSGPTSGPMSGPTSGPNASGPSGTAKPGPNASGPSGTAKPGPNAKPGDAGAPVAQSGPPPAASDEIVPPPPTASGATATAAPFNIDWDTLNSGWEKDIVKAESKLQGAQVQVSGPMITLVAIVKDGFSEKDLDGLKKTMLTTYNDLARKQDGQIGASKSGNYGGLYEKYAVLVGITTQKNQSTQDKWMLNEMVSSSSY